VEQFDRVRRLWEDPDSTVQRLQEIGEAPTLQDELMTTLYRSPSLHPEAGLSILEMVESGVEPGTSNWKGVVSFHAMMLASLGRLAEARPLFDTLWALGGPRESIAYVGLMPVSAGLVLLHQAMLYELTRGQAAEARRLGEEALAADSAPRFDFMLALIEAGFGWADIIDGDTVGGLERLRGALYEAGYAYGPVFQWTTDRTT
jgi:hypothetical protein